VYDLVEALYEIHDLGDDNPSPTTYMPSEADDGDDDLVAELTDQ
jgi:hypothetical protein